jgi:hypothetical protein
VIDWAGYRARYDAMTYADVAAFHDGVWDAFPAQEQHSRAAMDAFFAGHQPFHVVELGGWRGEAAARVLAAHPEIRSWDNFEVCRPAAESPVTADPRYRGLHPETWAWEQPPRPYDVAVLSHVIEHMKGRQVAALVAWLAACGVRRAYVEAPIRDKPRTWHRSHNGHVLELGWRDVRALFAAHGFVVTHRESYDEPGHPTRHVLIFEVQP